MMKNEFEWRIGREIPMDEYKLIEFVYTWSPIISDYNGKDEIVRLFEVGGMELIEQLVPAAKIAQTKERLIVEIDKIQSKVEKYQTIAEKLDDLSEDSSDYWEKSSKLLDKECDLMDEIENLKAQFKVV